MLETLITRNDCRWGEVLRDLRQRGKASQKKLGALLDIHESTIAKYESSSRNPIRRIPFYESLAAVGWLNEQDVSQLLLTQDGPRWLEPDKNGVSKAAAEFGKLLRFYRERADLSQGKLAGVYRGELDDSTIARVEDGSRKPPHTSQFYDRLPETLQLSQKEYAGLLLTGRPPRWLVPHLYDIVETDNSVLTTPKTYIRRTGFGLNIRIGGNLEAVTDEQLIALKGMINTFFQNPPKQ